MREWNTPEGLLTAEYRGLSRYDTHTVYWEETWTCVYELRYTCELRMTFICWGRYHKSAEQVCTLDWERSNAVIANVKSPPSHMYISNTIITLIGFYFIFDPGFCPLLSTKIFLSVHIICVGRPVHNSLSLSPHTSFFLIQILSISRHRHVANLDR